MDSPKSDFSKGQASPLPEVLVFTQEFPPDRGGAGTVCLKICESLKDLGGKVEVFAPGPTEGYPGDDDYPFPINRNGSRGTRDWPCRIKVLKKMKACLGADQTGNRMVYLGDSGTVSAAMFSRALFRSSVPVVITLHGSEIPLFGKGPVRKRLFAQLLRRAQRIHLLSQANADLLHRYFPEMATPVTVTGGAPTIHFPEKAPDRRERAGNHPIRILTVGRIHPRKGQMELAKALGELPPKLRQRIEWRIIGPRVDSAYAEKTRALALRNNLRFHLTGQVSGDDLVREYQNADLFAMTSMPLAKSIEGLGLVYLDAAAVGLPIIAHNVGGVREVVFHENTGYLVSPGNRSELVEALERLITDPELRNKMGQSGKAYAGKLNWKTITRKIFSPEP